MNKQHISYVIIHPLRGIYLGNCMGLGFWSMWDTVGQTHACTFATEHQAREHISSWILDNNPNDYKLKSVKTIREDYASVDELAESGLKNQVLKLYMNKIEYDQHRTIN